jgi:hypothetical protein
VSGVTRTHTPSVTGRHVFGLWILAGGDRRGRGGKRASTCAGRLRTLALPSGSLRALPLYLYPPSSFRCAFVLVPALQFQPCVCADVPMIVHCFVFSQYRWGGRWHFIIKENKRQMAASDERAGLEDEDVRERRTCDATRRLAIS